MVWVVFMNRPEKWVSGRFEKDGEPIGSRDQPPLSGPDKMLVQHCS